MAAICCGVWPPRSGCGRRSQEDASPPSTRDRWNAGGGHQLAGAVRRSELRLKRTKKGTALNDALYFTEKHADAGGKLLMHTILPPGSRKGRRRAS